ncbi:neprilysin-1-like [Haematobia irritans]|uniref:neprilysin-1-like n=1 Tax=Haematobia irritans TaxID=7368 RepID=UPI003F4F9A0E
MTLIRKSAINLLVFRLIALASNVNFVNSENEANRRQLEIIETSMDSQIDPCEDFYQYSCAKWNNRNMFYIVKDQANKDLDDYIKVIDLENKPAFVNMAYDFFQSCVNIENISIWQYLVWLEENENLNLTTQLSDLYKIEDMDWIRLLAVMHKYDFGGFIFDTAIIEKGESPSEVNINLSRPKKRLRPLSTRQMEDIASSIDNDIEEGEFNLFWVYTRTFESMLQELLVMAHDDTDEKNVEDIDIDNINLPWLRQYLETVMGDIPATTKVKINVEDLSYFRRLEALVNLYDNRFIGKYLLLKFIWYMIGQTDDFSEKFGCMESTRNQLPFAMHWVYEQMRTDINEDMWDTHQMFHTIKMQMKKELLRNKNLLNDTTLIHLLYKLDNLQLKVANLPRENTIEILENFYSKLDIDIYDFYGNHLKLLAFNRKRKDLGLSQGARTEASRFFQPNTKPELENYTPNFLDESHVVYIPNSVLQSPMYNNSFHDVFKYSNLGVTLAHEILHAFDFGIFHRGIDGKIIDTHQEAMITNPKFNESFQCMHSQYKNAKDDRIADIRGLHYAYEALAKKLQLNGTEDFTFEQQGIFMSLDKIFYLNFALSYCDSSPKSGDKYHGTVQDRVNDSVYYSSKFNEAFNLIITPLELQSNVIIDYKAMIKENNSHK